MLVFTDTRGQPDIGSMGAVAKALDLRPQLPLPPVPRLEPLAARQVGSTLVPILALLAPRSEALLQLQQCLWVLGSGSQAYALSM